MATRMTEHRSEKGPDPRLTAIVVPLAILGILIVAVIFASVPQPSLHALRPGADEIAAVVTLRSIARAQEECRKRAVIDVDGDGEGEYGYLAELAGAVGIRDRSGSPGAKRISPPLLSAGFGNVSLGWVTRSGYIFQMFLPDKDALPVPEHETGGVNTRAPHPSQAEKVWCCYAWPSSHPHSGRNAFFINQEGTLLVADDRPAGAASGSDRPYSGTLHTPRPDAAFLKGSRVTLDSPIAESRQGIDGRMWRRVSN